MMNHSETSKRFVRAAHALILVAGFAVPASAATVTIEKVARSIGNSIFNRDPALTDPVPGRPSPFVFWSSSDPPSPAINESGEVVFVGFSASSFNINSGGEFGIYVKRPLQPLAVLVDTTVDSLGNPTFPVPGHPGTRFISLEAPLVNNNGDVVFWARFFNTTTFAQSFGFFSTKTTGGPIVKIVDSFDTPAGHPATARFESFTFTVNNPSTFGASLNDLGEVVYWGQFCDAPPCTSTSRLNGIFGTTVSGTTHVRLADSSRDICPTNIPFGLTCDPTLAEGFWEIRPEIAINNAGIVAFHGGIRRSPPSLCCRGTFSVPVSGAVAPTTVAFRSQTAPPATPSAPASSFQDRFDDNDINEAGDYLFVPLLTAPCCVQKFGLFTGDVTGGPLGNVVDTLVGNGLAVPGDVTGSEFNTVSMAPINESGQLGFFAFIRNSATSNNQGIYAADMSGGPISLVMDAAATPPGQPVGAHITSFQGRSAAINDDGNMVFWGTGVRPTATGGLESLFGMYFFEACTGQVVRIADSSTSAVELGAGFGVLPGAPKFGLFQSGEARSGHYRSINNSNDVAFLAKFSNFGWGIYIAHIQAGGGPLAITCPPDRTGAGAVECGGDISPTATGTATAVGGCSGTSVPTTFSDVPDPVPAGPVTVSRTWTATDTSGGSASCVQIISVVDATAPSLSGVPANVSVECDAVPVPASPTASDICDPAANLTFTETRTNGICADAFTLTRSWTARDGSANETTQSQVISVSDTTPPTVTCPAELSLSGGFGGSNVTFTTTAADNCDPASLVTTSVASGSFFNTGLTSVAATGMDRCGNSASCMFDVLVSCFSVNRAKIGTKDVACRGVEEIELSSSNGTEELISLYKAVEGQGGGVLEDILPPSIEVNDGVNGPVTLDTSCTTPIAIGDVFGPYTVTDIKEDFDDNPDNRGNKLEFRGSFNPAVAFDLALDDVTYTVSDGSGHAASFTIPAGSFQSDGKPEKKKFKFEGPIGTASVEAKFEGCKFKFEAEGVTETGLFVGTSITFRVDVGRNVGLETVVMEDKGNHLKFKRKPKVECCPKCEGVASLQVTSNQGVLVFQPDAGQTKLPANITVDDLVNGPVTIHASCSQPLDVGDTFGPYTVSEVVKIFAQP